MTKTWRTRLARLRHHGRRIGRIALVVAAVFGAAAACRLFLVPDRPDIAATAQRIGNQADQVGAFAADFVTTWLTATTAQLPALQRFVTLSDGAPPLPTTPAAVVTTPQVVSVIRTGALGDGELYAATISLNERPYASAASVRAFYRVPVLMWDHQPRAVAMPARVNGPGPGADSPVRYPLALGAESPVFAVVAGFIRTFLTATTGLDRYVLTKSGLTPVGGYQNAVVATAAADRAVLDTMPAGTRIHVLANVTAQTTQFANVAMAYPLTVENSDGTWMVAAIDLTPQVTAEPTPVAVTPN